MKTSNTPPMKKYKSLDGSFPIEKRTITLHIAIKNIQFLQPNKIKTCNTIIKTQDKRIIHFVHRYCICETGVKNSSIKTRS